MTGSRSTDVKAGPDLESDDAGNGVEHREDLLDEALDETFPASDPAAPPSVA